MASTTTALITQNSSTPLAIPGTASQKDAEAAAAPTSAAQSTSPSKRGFFSSFRKKKRDKDKKEQEGKGRGGGAAAAGDKTSAVNTPSSSEEEEEEASPARQTSVAGNPATSATTVSSQQRTTTTMTPPSPQARSGASSPTSTKHVPPRILTTPSPTLHASSPSPGLSPRLSPSNSTQIFERNVQDPLHRPASPSPSIPSHITTEDHIPPVLEASVSAITDASVDPSRVEIVTQRAHLSASTVLSASPPPGAQQGGGESSPGQSTSPYLTAADVSPDAHSPPGALPEDLSLRRLSFISFADVVQAENAEHIADAAEPVPGPSEGVGMGSIEAALSEGGGAAGGRSPSPARSRKGPASGPERVEEGLVVENLGQAVRRVGSVGEFGGVGS